jgi:holo-[acyl-carrier protein] synthase
MIVGTGVDIVEVSRVEQAIGRYGDRFLSRIFTEREIRYCNSKRNHVERFAARFAAKEAAMKALGTGLRRGVSWQHIEVGHQPGGRPTIIFSDAAAEIAAQLGAKRVSLSVSHTEQHAIAQVILED